MALKWCILLGMVMLAAAQPSSISPSMPAPSPAASSPAASTSMPAEPVTTPTAPPTSPTTSPTTPPTTMMDTSTSAEPTTEAPTVVANVSDTAAVRYVSSQANKVRREHFYCLDANDAGFPIDNRTLSNNDITYVRWSVFLQYPVLAYLDTMKKGFLVEGIANIINLGGGTVTPENFCVADVANHRVSYYDESVLVQFYFRNIVDDGTLINRTDMYFREGFEKTSSLVRMFQGQKAIIINSTSYGKTNESVHPGAFTTNGERFNPEEDPTLNAVVLGSWVGSVTVDAAIEELNIGMFAENPNPIFYGLTGGDVVFAVIGTILLLILGFLIVFGFCIQPFLM